MNFVQKKKAEHKSKLKSDPVTKLPTADHFVLSEDKEEKLSQIIAEINSIAGKEYDNDVAVKAMLQIKDREQTKDYQYDNKEEKRVITGYESLTARKNKEGIRKNHKGKNFSTKNSFSIK